MLTHISGNAVPLLLRRHSKLGDEKLDAIEDIADEALKGVVTSSALPLGMGLGVGFGIAGLSGMPILGICAGAYFVYSAIDGAVQKGNHAEYIKDTGLLAHALDEVQLVKYCEIIGVDGAVTEILTAYQDNQPITTAARKLCLAMGKTPKRRTIATFLEEIKQLQELPIESSGASPGTSPAVAPTIAGGTCRIQTAIDAMVNPVRSSYISAPPRTGKGIMMAIAMSSYKQKHPTGTLYSYTPKQDPKEDWYWDVSDQHFNPDLDQNLTRAAQTLYAMIRHWQSLSSSPTAPILFVLDELSTTLTRFKSVKLTVVDELFEGEKRTFSDWLLDFLIHEASMRQSVDRFVWVMTPLATVSESGASAGALKSMKNFTLASRDNVKFADGGNATFAAPKIGTDHPLFNQYRTIAYSHDSQTWLPIPTVSDTELEKRSASIPKLKMWGDIPAAVVSEWGTDEPITAVFARALAESFIQPSEESESIDRQVWNWSYQKLTRFPEGKTMRELWNDAPNSITTKTDRFSFDGFLRTAIDVGFLLETDDRLTHNPEMQP